MVRRWPVLPLKVTRARCPWRAMFTFTDAPLIWMTPSARSWDSVSGALPVRVPAGATRIVYVPVAGSDGTWSDPPLKSVPPDVSTLPAGGEVGGGAVRVAPAGGRRAWRPAGPSKA